MRSAIVNGSEVLFPRLSDLSRNGLVDSFDEDERLGPAPQKLNRCHLYFASL